MTFIGKKNFYKLNGQKGGRPKQDSNIHITLPDVNLVELTSEQYFNLLDKYGNELLQTAIKIFDEWLTRGGASANKYIGKNHYAHFRIDGWLINEARRVCRI